MPAAAKYCARGHPSPPQPTINTEVLSKFNCPVNNKTNVAVFIHLILLYRMLSWGLQGIQPYLAHPALAGEAVCYTAVCPHC